MQISGDFQWKSQVFLPCLLPVRGPSMFCYDLFFWQPACSIFLACVFMTYVWFLLKQQKTAQGWGWFFWAGYCLFPFPFRNYAKGHLEALIPVKLCRRIDGGFGSAEGHRSNGLPPRRARRWDLQPRLSPERGHSSTGHAQQQEEDELLTVGLQTTV